MAAALAALLLAPAALAGCTSAEEPPVEEPFIVPDEVEYIDTQLFHEDKVLYVFKDAGDGLNHFTQRYAIGADDPAAPLPPLDETAVGKPASGSSSHLVSTGLKAALDLAVNPQGGYVFSSGFSEFGGPPQPDYGQVDAALDLTGAVKLVFDAQGDTGAEQVEFFVGGVGWSGGAPDQPYPDSSDRISTGSINLPAEWTHYEIPLDGADLSRIAGGFGWWTTAEANPGAASVAFTLDNVYFEFAESKPGPLLLPSYEPSQPGTPAAALDNVASIRANALAAIALTAAGRHDRARQIADAFVYALGHDRTFSDGRLRNAYLNGDPRSDPGWLSPDGRDYARLPGSWSAEDGVWREDPWAGSTSSGDLAWAMLALTEVAANAPDRTEYAEAAQKIAAFLFTLTDETNGFTAGYVVSGDGQDKSTAKKTADNFVLWGAFRRLSLFMGEQESTTWAVTYAAAAEKARLFAKAMYGADCACFRAGTAADGSEDAPLALADNSLALLVMGQELAEADQVLAAIAAAFGVGQGFDADADKDGVWYEGTVQVQLAYAQAGEADVAAVLLGYVGANRLADWSLPAADRDGLTTGLLSPDGSPTVYDKRSSLEATAWLGLAQMGVNPLGKPA
jgi:hypothetical protein